MSSRRDWYNEAYRLWVEACREHGQNSEQAREAYRRARKLRDEMNAEEAENGQTS